MNERIKKLAEQAWDSTRDEIGSFVDDGGEVNWDFLHTYNKKFAELIVRECAYWMENEYDEQGGRIDDIFYWASKMRKHFGVEK